MILGAMIDFSRSTFQDFVYQQQKGSKKKQKKFANDPIYREDDF